MKSIFRRSVNLCLVMILATSLLTSCGMPKKMLGAAGGIFNAVFGNDGVICKIPLISNITVKLLGGCQITNVEQPAAIVADDGTNWGSTVDVLPDPIFSNKKIDAKTVCTVHLWDFDNGITTVVKSKADEIPAGKPKYGCNAPKVELRSNDGTDSMTYDINSNNRASLNNMQYDYASNSETNSYNRVYQVIAFCDTNGNDIYDGGEKKLARGVSPKMTVNYQFHPGAASTVAITQDIPLTVIWKNTDKIKKGGIVPGCDAKADPLVVDLFGNGFKFERTQKLFDYDVDGIPEKWYGIKATENDDAFIVLDIDGNKKITSGAELFGNYTTHYLVPKNKSCRPTRYKRCKFFKRAWKTLPKEGFQALAIYDTAEAGGNKNGWIDSGDAIYPYLKLWVQDLSDDHVLGKNLVPIALFKMKVRITGYTEMNELDSRTLNRTRFRSTVKMDRAPMRLQDTRSNRVFDVKETVVADIWFNVL